MSSAERGSGNLLPMDIPDNLTLPQFLFDIHHRTRPPHAQSEACLIDESSGKKTSLKALHARSVLLANAIGLKWGIGSGDVVALLTHNHVDILAVILAVHKLGGVITLSDPTFAASQELISQLKSTHAKLVITHPDFLNQVGSAAEQAGIALYSISLLENPTNTSITFPHHDLPTLIADFDETDTHFAERKLEPGEGKKTPAFYFFSSGLSGLPKPVSISHYAIIANIIQRAEHFKIYDTSITSSKRKFMPGDVSLAVLPISYLHGLVNLLFTVYCGMSSVIVPKFNFQEMFKDIVRYQITHLFLVPSQVILICKNPLGKNFDMKHVKYCVVGGQALPSIEFVEGFANLFPNCSIDQTYGLTEMTTAVTISPVSQKMISTVNSVGTFLPHIQYRVVKDDGSLASSGEYGELWVTGPAMAIEYLDDDQANRETFRDNWVRTGDKVMVDDRGELHIVGRYKSVFKVRAFQVSPDELEAHIRTHPDIDEVCVVSVPDLYSGEVPVAFVVLGDEALARIEAQEAELQKIKLSIIRFVADVKANYKWIGGGVEVRSSFPITPHGRVNRDVLRQEATRARESTQLHRS